MSEQRVNGGPTPFDSARLEAFVGQRIDGRYRVDGLVGRGGMGAVYRAIDERLGRAVALKVLYHRPDPSAAPEPRLREARVAGAMGHPNIVQVLDLGTLSDGTPFQVMELIEGPTLAQRIQEQGSLDEPEVLALAEQILSALEAAHAEGVLHLDLKPENVMLAYEGATGATAKLLDFGASRALAGHTHSLTRTDVIVGTPHYLSPEQARGGVEVDARADLWAMGVLLYEALTGVLPFNASTHERLLQKILAQRPVPPSRFCPRMTPAVETLVLRALSVAPEDRPASAREMLEEVRHARTLVSTSARPRSHPPPAPRARRDTPVSAHFVEAPTELGRPVPPELLARDEPEPDGRG